MLNFKKIEIKDKNIINEIFYNQESNSCQISFNAMFTTQNKYGSMYDIKDDVIYIKRFNLCDNIYNVYLMPISKNNTISKEYIDEILDDAKRNKKKVKFETITENEMMLLSKFYPNFFNIYECRDYFEYIYSYDTLANLNNSKLSKKRYDIKTFFRDYGDGIEERIIKESDIEDIRAFQKKWLSQKLNNSDKKIFSSLINENDVINISLDNYNALNFSGIIIKYKKEIIGYAFGFKLTDTAFDVYIEKGDINFADIYKVLNRDLVRLCCQNYQYINREEDIGIENLRVAKLSYMPTVLMKKYIAMETNYSNQEKNKKN